MWSSTAIKRVLGRKYNLIEVTLALVVVAVGVSAVMSIFPVGLENTKRSTGIANASDAADQLLHFLASRINADKDYIDCLPSSMWTGNDGLVVWSDQNMSGGNDLIFNFKSINATDTFDPAVFQDGVFRVKQLTGGQVADFEGIMRMWAEDARVTFDQPAQYNPVFDAAIFGETIVDMTNMGTLSTNGSVLSDGSLNFGNITTGTINGSAIGAVSYSNPAGITVSDTEGIGPVDITLPVPAPPTSTTDSNWQLPILIVSNPPQNDLTINGDFAFEGTIYVPGNIHINSGQNITGNGSLVAGGDIHFNNINGTVGSGSDHVMFYAMASGEGGIHFNNCTSVTMNGLLFAPNGKIALNNIPTVSISGGVYANSVDWNNVNTNATINANTTNLSLALPPAMYTPAINVKKTGHRYVLYVESSFPASRPYAKRTKKIHRLSQFRFDVTDQ